MKSQTEKWDLKKNEISNRKLRSQKKWNLKKKKWKQKIFEYKNFRIHSVSVTDNGSLRQCQDLVNVGVRQCQCQTMSGSS